MRQAVYPGGFDPPTTGHRAALGDHQVRPHPANLKPPASNHAPGRSENQCSGSTTIEPHAPDLATSCARPLEHGERASQHTRHIDVTGCIHGGSVGGVDGVGYHPIVEAHLPGGRSPDQHGNDPKTDGNYSRSCHDMLRAYAMTPDRGVCGTREKERRGQQWSPQA